VAIPWHFPRQVVRSDRRHINRVVVRHWRGGRVWHLLLPGKGRDVALDKKSTDAVYSLHKGLGVRDSKLVDLVRTTCLAQQWDILNTDVSIVVRTKVIYRLAHIFSAMPSPDALVAPVVYNTVADPGLYDVVLKQRVDDLPLRFPGLSLSPRTTSRIIERLSAEIERHVDLPPAPFDHQKLDAIKRQEREFADEVERLHDSTAFERLVRAGYAAPIRQAHRALLTQRLVTPLSATDHLVIARTRLGDWVCAFGSVPALRAYQAATSQQNHGDRTLSGADLVRDLLARPHPIGVVFNPTPVRSGDVRSTLRLPPGELADLARHL
jgi:hypothetical protein